MNTTPYPQTPTKTEREPQIIGKIDSIMGDIGLIEKAITTLREKISPVLLPESLPQPEMPKALSSSRSALSEQLVNINCSINNIKQLIEEITQRVDL